MSFRSINEVPSTPLTNSFTYPPNIPTRLIVFPKGVKLTSTPMIGLWLNTSCTPKPVGLSWVYGPEGKFCQLALVVKGVNAIVNECIIREWSSVGIQSEVPPPRSWTPEQQDR